MATDASILPVAAESTFPRGDGVRLHAVAAGDENGPLVVLLHGFPDFFYGWRRQVRPLVRAGYRVVAVDQRGYNRSDKPVGIESYRIGALARDVVAVIESAGRASAHLVGHDWGATVAWNVALRRPAVVDRLAILNVPHPAAFRRTLRRSPRQLLRSWYALFFQLPWLPERVFAREEFAPAADRLRESADPGAFTDEDLARYREAWRPDGATTAMLNWYRAAARYGTGADRERVAQPTLVLWGEEDPALVPELAPRSVAYCEDGRLERFPDAGHWIHLDRPDAVSELLVEHLSG
jgi:pimeloyl-ACP methyl ester carboxylesterase